MTILVNENMMSPSRFPLNVLAFLVALKDIATFFFLFFFKPSTDSGASSVYEFINQFASVFLSLNSFLYLWNCLLFESFKFMRIGVWFC
uniref:Uncharacterized protein n=1 Tax=Cucumis sativus TaxID=3659 RepID=A0A0A0KBH9_CUCSA